MATPKILLKRSNVAGSVPSSLDSGEFALNTADGKIYYTGHDGNIHAFLDSAGVNTLIENSVATIDSAQVIQLIDSDYVQARQLTYTIPTLGNDFVDSAQVQSIINAAYVKNIVDSAYVASIVETDGDITITITNEITSTVDSAYVNERVNTANFLDSAEAINLIDSAYVRLRADSAYIKSVTGIDADTLDGEHGTHYLDYNNFTNTPTILDNVDIENQIDSDYVRARQITYNTSDFTDSDYVEDRIDSAINALIGGAPEALNTLNELAEALGDDSDAYNTLLSQIGALPDSAEVKLIIDSAYIQLRQIKYLDSDLVKAISLDSSEIPSVVTQGYVRDRQDFRFDQLTGAPTSLSDFANDLFTSTDDLGEGSTNLYYTTARTESDATALVDSAYVQARQITYTIPSLGNDFVDSAEALKLIDANALDSGRATALIDSAYVQARQLNFDNLLDSAEVTALVDSDYVQARQITYTLPVLGTDFVDSAEALKLIDANALDSARATSLINSDYVQARQITYTLPVLGTDFVDSDQVEAIVDSAYVQLRQTAQDFAYSSLTDAPTIPAFGTDYVDSAFVTNLPVSTFTNDANYLDSTTVLPLIPNLGTNFIDSAEALKLIDANALDSGRATSLVDSAYVQLRQTAQDFSYASLTGTPTNVSTFTNDAGYLTNATTTSLIDSAYVKQRVNTNQDLATTDSVTFSGLTVSGNLNVTGTTYQVNTIAYTINDPLIHLADSNENSDVVDIGFIGHYYGNAQRRHAGVFRDASNEEFYIFNNMVDSSFDSVSPPNTINRSATGFQLATLNVGAIYGQYQGFDSDFNQKSTTDLSEGTNLYYTTARSDSDTLAQVDSAYVQLRQDYAYGSLTGTPTIPAFGTDYVDSAFVTGQNVSTFANDANYLDSTTVTGVIDSAYINLKAPSLEYVAINSTGALPTAQTDGAIAIGSKATTNSTRHGIPAGGNRAIAIGDSAEAIGHDAIAIGTNATTGSDGYYIEGVAIGKNATIEGGSRGTAVGGNSKATLQAAAFGHGADARGDYSVALGNQTTIDSSHNNSVAIGRLAVTSAANQLMLGDDDDAVSGFTSIRVGNRSYEPSDDYDLATKLYVDSQITSSTLSLGTDFIDSAEALKLIDANALDSGRAISLIDSAYVQARQTDIRDSAFVTGIIDSDYVRLQTRIGDSDIDFGSHKILYSNVYSAEGDLPDANTYHGMFAHVHGTGAGYFAHAGNWVRLANQSEVFDGTYASLTGKPDFFDSNDATILIDSAYVQARTTAGTDSAATIALIEATVDSAYVQAREAAGGGGGGVDSAATVTLITNTVDSAYVLARVDSNYEKPITQTVYLFTADSGQTAFVDSDDNGNVLSFTSDQQLTVFLNGILLTGTSDISTNASTNTITLAEAADSGDILSIIKLSGAKPHIDSDMINNISLKHVTYVYTADSGQTAFTGADDNNQTLAIADNSRVSLNGILLLDTIDYVTTGTTVTLTTSADSGDILTIEKFQGRDAALDSSLINNVDISFTQYVYTADSGDTTFSGADDNGLTLAYSPSRVRVHINGILQVDSADYTASNGTSVTLIEEANAGDVIQIEKFVGRDVGLDSAEVKLIIDSAYIQARTTAGTDSAAIIQLIDSDYIQARQITYTLPVLGTDFVDSAQVELIIDSAYVQLRQDFAYSSLTGTPTIPAFGTDYIDSATVVDIIASEGLDSDLVINLVDSAYIQLRDRFQDSSLVTSTVNSTYIQDRQIKYSTADFADSAFVTNSLPVLGTDFIDSAQALILIDANALDSARATSLIDSAYVRLQTRIGDSDIDFGTNKILYSNVYSAEGDLPSASTYHGMFAHVHATGAGYFAHAGNWVRLANQSEIFDGTYASLTGTPTLPVLGTDFIDSAEALKLIDANALDSGRAISLIDSAYVAARSAGGGTDSAATIALIEATVDSAYVQLREGDGGGGGGSQNVFQNIHVSGQDSIVADGTSDILTFEAGHGIDITTDANTDTVTIAYGLEEDHLDSAAVRNIIDTELQDGNTIRRNIFTYEADSGDTTFTGADDNSQVLNVIPDNSIVFMNGILLSETTDYTLTSSTLTMTEAMDSGYLITIIENVGKSETLLYTEAKYEYTLDSGTTYITGADNDNVTLVLNTTTDNIDVFMNGILLSETTDYTIDSSSITLIDDADSADLLTIVTRRGDVVTPAINAFEYTADSGQTTFTGSDDNSSTLKYSSGAIQVHVNGILLRETDYTATNGSSVVLTEAADSGDDILISAFSAPAKFSHWTEVTATQAVASNTKNIIDCSSGPVTITFPAAPDLGDEIRIIDGTGSASTNNIIINRNGNKIQGVADNFTIDVNRAAVGFVYYNAAQGWILIEN